MLLLQFPFLILVAALLSQDGQVKPTDSLIICCGGEQVYILNLEDENPDIEHAVWKWSAKDSLRIPAEFHKSFRSTDECKPLTDSILITSSSGGVALIRRADKRCLFLAHAKNAHSACILPRNQIAVASSFGGVELLLYEIPHADDKLKLSIPVASIPLPGAHGTVWDEKRNRLWALGNEKLCLVEIRTMEDKTKLVIESEFVLPTRGGHDLSQMRDESKLFVTSNDHVYRFSKIDGSFKLDEEIGDQKRVKSATEHPVTGEIVYHMGTPEHWWSNSIRFPGKRSALRLPDQRLYKVRWDFAEKPKQ